MSDNNESVTPLELKDFWPCAEPLTTLQKWIDECKAKGFTAFEVKFEYGYYTDRTSVSLNVSDETK